MKKEELKSKIYDLLKGNYGCSRVWEAWQYGTMHEEDFYPLEENEQLIGEFITLITKHTGEVV